MKETFYFSHDYNTRSDAKIKKLIQKHGYFGYGIFWCLVEDLYQNANALQTQSESNAIKVNKRKVNKIKLKEDIIIPTESEFINYISENSKECDLNAAKLKYKSWVENGWKDGNSQPIINWKSKALNIIPYLPKKEANLFNRVQTAKHDSDY